jgi:amino acid permease
MVGTGLLYQSGEALANAGAVSLFLSYLLMGSVVYSLQVQSTSITKLMKTDHPGGDDHTFAHTRGRFHVTLQVPG